MDDLIERITEWARNTPDIVGSMVVGSRARVDHPADEFSDLDVLLVAEDPNRYLLSADWLEAFGRPRITFVEATAVGSGLERRVLFEDGADVDFVLFSPEDTRRAVELKEVAGVLTRGYRVLYDRDGLMAEITASSSTGGAESQPAPVQSQLDQATADFWYHAVWAVRKLRRGEVWIARFCCDSYMKMLLLQMIEWHAKADTGRVVDTWFLGRFLERWAEPWILDALRSSFSHYDPDDVHRALLATMDLYRRLATEVAERLGLRYAVREDAFATDLVQATL